MMESSRRTFLASAGLLAGHSLAMRHAEAAGLRDQPIRVGQIGTKHAHASGKMATFRKFPEVFDVVGVVEPDDIQWGLVSSQPAYKGLKRVSEDELLGHDGLQAVAVETEIEQLLDTAERCVNRGVHIHLDKPAGTSLTQFRRICTAADQKGVAIQLGYMFRSNPAFRFLFTAVRDGWLGDVFQVHCEMSKKVGDSTRPALAKYPGGAMFELGCHLIDAVVTVLGKPQAVRPFLRNSRPDFDQLHDNCLAVFEYAAATATIRSSVCEIDGGRRRQFVVCGTKGSIVIQPLEPHRLTLTLESDTGSYKRGTRNIELPASTGRYDGDLLHLADVIRGKTKAEYETRHDLIVQQAILEASQMPLND